MLNPMARFMTVGLKMLDLEQVERVVEPTNAQRPAFNELKAAVATAEEEIRNSCPGKPPATLPARLEAAETRFAAMAAGIRAVRPAVDAFYNTLSEKQKSRFDAIRPEHETQGSQRHQHGRQ
jgi:hypothetical protein